MTKFKHTKSPPDIPCLINILAEYHIRYVIVGSVAAQLYGAEVQPGDFDIVPAQDLDNLTHLAQLLQNLEATLPDTDDTGHWEVQADGEKKWVSRKITPQERIQRAEWVPIPEDISTFDSLFHTRCGDFDIVPNLSGDYQMLMQRARKIPYHEHEVWLLNIDELLAALTVPRRKKDVNRVRQLREIQRKMSR